MSKYYFLVLLFTVVFTVQAKEIVRYADSANDLLTSKEEKKIIDLGRAPYADILAVEIEKDEDDIILRIETAGEIPRPYPNYRNFLWWLITFDVDQDKETRSWLPLISHRNSGDDLQIRAGSVSSDFTWSLGIRWHDKIQKKRVTKFQYPASLSFEKNIVVIKFSLKEFDSLGVRLGSCMNFYLTSGGAQSWDWEVDFAPSRTDFYTLCR